MTRTFYLATLRACPHLNLKDRWLIAINTANAALMGHWVHTLKEQR